jgi:hypothetical protein
MLFADYGILGSAIMSLGEYYLTFRKYRDFSKRQNLLDQQQNATFRKA